MYCDIQWRSIYSCAVREYIISLCIIRQYQDSRIHVISHHKFKEKAVSVWDKMACVRENFEEALKYAKGDIIFISDQDDVWLPNKVQSVLDSMSS